MAQNVYSQIGFRPFSFQNDHFKTFDVNPKTKCICTVLSQARTSPGLKPKANKSGQKRDQEKEVGDVAKNFDIYTYLISIRYFTAHQQIAFMCYYDLGIF